MRLDPPIQVMTPLGLGLAYFLEDGPAGVEWQVFIRRTGESWYFRNPYIRLAPEATIGIGPVSPFYNLPPELERHIARYKTNGWLT